jgi:hypothetical protein
MMLEIAEGERENVLRDSFQPRCFSSGLLLMSAALGGDEEGFLTYAGQVSRS